MTSSTLKTMNGSFSSYHQSINRMGDIYASNSQNMNDWVIHCKALLLKMECTNIETRSNHWSSIVNTQTHHTNHRLNINQTLTPYKYPCDALSHLSFLSEWKGLKMRQITNYPRTYTEFEAKAKNWLNGRRAPNYGATLFPDMIKTAETYAHNLAEQLFATNDEFIELYFSVLMYAYLAALCSERITMNNASKRTPLLLENSLKYCKTPTAKMLQNYAQDYPYPHQFPSHLRQAADFFHTKYDNYMNRIYMKQNGGSMTVNPNLRLNSSLFTTFPGNNNLIINEIKFNKEKHKNEEQKTLKMKTDTDSKSSGETAETASHSDASSASAITPIAPKISNYNVPLPLPPPIPLLISNTHSTLVSDNSMVRLTSNQYAQLVSKIESLERTQLQQRQVIACLAGKLQDLEYKNNNNNNNQHIQLQIPPLPPMPSIQTHNQMMSSVPLQSVPMTDINDQHNFMPATNMVNNNIMPTIDAANNINHHNVNQSNNSVFQMDYTNFNEFNSNF